MNLKYIPILFGVLLLVACSNPHNIVEEANRDTTGQFDGRWRVKIGGTDKYQSWSRWRMTCADFERSFEMAVTDSVVKLLGVNQARGLQTYVDDNGHFALAIPSDARARESGGSEKAIVNKRVTYYLRGNLAPDKLKGVFIRGIQEFGEMGCTTRVRYSKLTDT